MKPIFLILAVIITASLFESCYYDKADQLYPDGKIPCDTSVVAKFSSEVLSVMNANCNTSGCHNTISASSGVILDTYAGVKAQVANGRLMGSINQTGSFSAMPKGGGKLNSCAIIKIQQWINSGTPNN
jgi:hypothetical protein